MSLKFLVLPLAEAFETDSVLPAGILLVFFWSRFGFIPHFRCAAAHFRAVYLPHRNVRSVLTAIEAFFANL
jgi:hypothetical protein